MATRKTGKGDRSAGPAPLWFIATLKPALTGGVDMPVATSAAGMEKPRQPCATGGVSNVRFTNSGIRWHVITPAVGLYCRPRVVALQRNTKASRFPTRPHTSTRPAQSYGQSAQFRPGPAPFPPRLNGQVCGVGSESAPQPRLLTRPRPARRRVGAPHSALRRRPEMPGAVPLWDDAATRICGGHGVTLT